MAKATNRKPETSTVRAALAVIGAVEDLTVTPDRREVAAVEAIIRAARELRPHQVEDVLAHLQARATDTPDEKDRPERDEPANIEDYEAAERQRRAEEAAARIQGDDA